MSLAYLSRGHGHSTCNAHGTIFGRTRVIVSHRWRSMGCVDELDADLVDHDVSAPRSPLLIRMSVARIIMRRC